MSPIYRSDIIHYNDTLEQSSHIESHCDNDKLEVLIGIGVKSILLKSQVIVGW